MTTTSRHDSPKLAHVGQPALPLRRQWTRPRQWHPSSGRCRSSAGMRRWSGCPTTTGPRRPDRTVGGTREASLTTQASPSEPPPVSSPSASAAQRSRSRCRIQQHVPPDTADLLVAAQQALPPVAGRFRNADGAGIPGLDVQLDPVQARDGPREGSQRLQRAGRDAAAPARRGDRVARRGAAGRQVPEPQADRADGVVGLGIGDGERKPLSFGQLAALPADPLQACWAVGCAGRLPMRGRYGSSPNSTARCASWSVNARSTTEP
jgi:hypothetical protein